MDHTNNTTGAGTIGPHSVETTGDGSVLWRRVGARAGVVAAAGATFVAGLWIGGLGGDTGNGPDGPVAPVAFHGPLESGDCEDLLAHFQREGERVLERTGRMPGMPEGDFNLEEAVPTAGADEVPSDSAGRSPEIGSSRTGTNVQEQGVDESDLVKTDGRVLARVTDNEIDLFDVSGTRPREEGSIRVPDTYLQSLLLHDDTLVAIGSPRSTGPSSDEDHTTVVSIDISDPTQPRVTHRSIYNTRLVEARQQDDVVRLVLHRPMPWFGDRWGPTGPGPIVEDSAPRGTAPRDSATRGPVDGGSRTPSTPDEPFEEMLAAPIEEWLPQVSDDGATPAPLVECGRVGIPEDSLGAGTLSVVGFDIDDPADRQVSAVATDSEVAYQSRDTLLVAATKEPELSGSRNPWGIARDMSRPEASTHLFSFALEGTSARFEASTRVRGRVSDRWAIDAAEGTLRVATQRDADNAVLVLRRDGDRLVTVGEVDRLGVDEEIKAVRWFDDLAVLVTFREIDPLYTVDLSDPADPRALGELKIPGFSEYLHPIGDDQLLAIGRHVPTPGFEDELSSEQPLEQRSPGAQAALFDLADLTDPVQQDVVHYGAQSTAWAGTDPHAFTWLPEAGVAATVVTGAPDEFSERDSTGGWGQGTYISLLRPEDGRLQERRVELGSQLDPRTVRVVPWRDGALVVTRDRVEPLDVG